MWANNVTFIGSYILRFFLKEKEKKSLQKFLVKTGFKILFQVRLLEVGFRRSTWG